MKKKFFGILVLLFMGSLGQAGVVKFLPASVPSEVNKLLITAFIYLEPGSIIVSDGKGLEFTCSSSEDIQKIVNGIHGKFPFILSTYAYEPSYSSISSIVDFAVAENGDLSFVGNTYEEDESGNPVHKKFAMAKDEIPKECRFEVLDFDETFGRI